MAPQRGDVDSEPDLGKLGGFKDERRARNKPRFGRGMAESPHLVAT